MLQPGIPTGLRPQTPHTPTNGVDIAEPALPRADVDAPARGNMPHFGSGEGEPRINQMFRRMCELGASDLHLSATMPPLVRKDGEMRPLADGAGPLSSDLLKHLLTPIMPPVNQAEFEARHDTDFAYEIAGLARFRANIFLDRNGIGAVFRVIPSKILTAEQLGLSPHILGLCELTKGLVLVTGPTGSGKSTTLCALIDYINRTRADHIITIEDPIEFVHGPQKCLINQREVHSHTRSFKDALRAALREDPDVILVGELRDLETIAIAIETAETGHLVFGTLHTTTAASTVDRVIDQFPADRQSQIRVMLSESLRGVIAQTLCRKNGGGRIAALEVLLINSAISNLIREGKTFQIPSMMQVGRAQGMVTLNEALVDLVRRDLVTAEEARLRAVDKSGIETLLKRA
ncbi:MAG TPA: type IV pilus twitching motility protein PilT [Gemmatimonadaceae bacterium]